MRNVRLDHPHPRLDLLVGTRFFFQLVFTPGRHRCGLSSLVCRTLGLCTARRTCEAVSTNEPIFATFAGLLSPSLRLGANVARTLSSRISVQVSQQTSILALVFVSVLRWTPPGGLRQTDDQTSADMQLQHSSPAPLRLRPC